MANPLTPALKVLEAKFKSILVPLILWLGFSFSAAIVASQFIQDDVTVHYIGIGTAFVLLFWWWLLAWRLGNQWMMDLQDLFVKNQMIPFNFPRFKGSMPWNVSGRREKLAMTAAAEYRKFREQAKSSNQTLEKYVGTGVTERASKNALSSELGGELRRVYVLFSDLRGFTHMTEQIKPEETVEILNKMFTGMEEVITQNGGDINKYIGDAIFAFFRRPYGNEGEAAKMVLRTAMRMQDKFEILNQSFKVAYSQPLSIGLGIGVTAGEAIMGNLGSANRMEFTLIGDTVNMASRLCGVAKHGQVLVNEEMSNAAKESFEMTPLPPMQIKGKSEMQTPYLVQGERLARTI
jgi:class 3 adenylate cyclase